MHRTHHARLTTALLAVAALTSLVAGPAIADTKSPSRLIGISGGLAHPEQSDSTVNGVPFVDKWLKAAQALPDYKFDFQMEVNKPGGGTIKEKGVLYFKQPRLLRIEETAGPKAGSLAVLLKDGSVKAHMGGGLKFFAVTLSPDSNYLKSANGWPMVKADFVSLAQAIQGYIKDGCTAKVTDTPVTSPSGAKVYDWTLNNSAGVIYKRALFDAQTMQPIEWWDYVDGKIYAHSVWTNFKSNIGLTDKTFTMKGDK
jgi:outer membrane lipoprotein-sorting protein